MPANVRLVSSSDYPAIASLVNAQADGDHQVDVDAFERIEGDWVRYDPAFRRVVAVADGVIVATGYTCASWGDSFEPGRSWLSITVHPDHVGDAIDVQVFDALAGVVGEGARELLACVREDHARQLAYLDRCGFSERFRSWGAHLKLDAFDPRRWRGLVDRLAADGVRLVLYHDLHADPERDAKLLALQDALEADVVHFEPIVPRRSSDIIGPETILDALVVAVTSDGSFVGLACLLGSPSDNSIGCGLTGVLPPYRGRGIATALKARTAEIAQGWGALELNTGGGGGTDSAIARASRAIGFEVEPPWVTYSKTL